MAESYDKVIEGPGGLPLVNLFGLNTNKDVSFRGALGVTGAISAGSTIGSVGIQTANSTTALSGTGTQGMGFSTVANFGIYWGSGIPTVTAATGSLYLNYGGTGVASRLYVNSGTTNWVAVTTVT